MRIMWLINTCGAVGRLSIAFVSYVGQIGGLTKESLKHVVPVLWGKTKGIRKESTVYQMVMGGVNSIPIVSLIMVLTGMILAMQSAYQLQKMNALAYIPGLVSVSITRELGPLLCAIIIAARVGASITAELGTMKVSEEIVALETMALDPIRFLVVPRFLALIIMVPCLTIIADLVGSFGGYIIGVTSLEMDTFFYIDKAVNAMVLKDIITGLSKSIAFGAIIALVGCHEGLSVKGGAEGVGKATTQSVVNSIVLVILADLIFTTLFYMTG